MADKRDIDYFLNTPGGGKAWQDFVKGSGGDTNRANDELVRAGQNFQGKFRELVGRDPNREEISKFYSDVVTGDSVGLVSRPNDLRPILNSYVSDEYSGVADSERKSNLAEKGKGNTGTVQNLFKNILGRDASEQESAHFARLMAETDADEYELGEALKMLPEYQQKADLTARNQLRGELAAGDERFFNKSVLPGVQSRFAQQGRSVDSSGFASAVANAGADLSANRESYLAGLGREDYVNSRQLAINQYLSGQQQQLADRNYGRARQDQLSDVYRNRSYELQDYDTQMRAYQDYVRNNGVRKKSTGGLFGGLGSLAGLGLGAAFAAPTGGMSLLAGSALGGSIGGTAGSIFDR